jgi:hypothetical protein
MDYLILFTALILTILTSQLFWITIVILAFGLIVYALVFKKRYTKRNIILVVSLIIIGCCLIIILGLREMRWQKGFMDGPFTGEDYSGNIKGNADSSITLGESYVVEIYNNLSDKAPVMVLRDKSENGRLLWAKILITNKDNFKNCKVHSVELTDVRRKAGKYQIGGGVYWTYGYEAALFYLDSDSKLLEYYFSW